MKMRNLLVVALIALYFMVYGTICYVAIHFVRKFW